VAKEYHDLTVVIKIPLYSQYERESSGQDYDVYVKQDSRVFCYTNIKPSRLSSILETVIFNPAVEVRSLPV